MWVTFVYFPIAHMVWDGSPGSCSNWGALDFAGGTVVHINAGIAGLVGCMLVGKRVGLGRDMMAPNSMPFTMVGASMLWVGWFGFNAGSNLEANGDTTLALINTFTATAGAIVAWAAIVESIVRGKASMLGAGFRSRRRPGGSDAGGRSYRPDRRDRARRHRQRHLLHLCRRGEACAWATMTASTCSASTASAA